MSGLLACQVISTVAVSGAILFGVKNVIQFRDYVLPSVTIRFFYIFGLLGLVVSLYQVWCPIDKWSTLQYLLPNAVIKNCAVCFDLCQAFSFLFLTEQLKNLEDREDGHNSAETTIPQKYSKVNVALIVSLVFFNAVFVTIFALTITSDSQSNENAKIKDLVQLSFLTWLAQTLSLCILIGSGSYTIWLIRRNFGTDNNFNECTTRMLVILVIFSICYSLMTCFMAVLYAYHSQERQDTVLTLMAYESCTLHVIEEVVPLCTIFALHQINYSSTAQCDATASGGEEQSRVTDTTGLQGEASFCSENSNNGHEASCRLSF